MFSKNRPNPAMKTYKGTEGPNHRLDYVNKNKDKIRAENVFINLWLAIEQFCCQHRTL